MYAEYFVKLFWLLLENVRKLISRRIHLPVVHWWERHRATIHNLSGWRRQWDVVVVRATQCATLIGHHGPASVVVFPYSAWCVSGSHLGN